MKRKVIRTAITSVLVTSMCMGSLPTAAAAMQAASKRAELSARCSLARAGRFGALHGAVE